MEGGRALLEQSIKAGGVGPNAFYLLAMCYKHLGRNADARQALARITEPDANVLLQRGVLSFAERDYVQARQDFALSWETEPTSYPAAYNLLLALLCQGQKGPCLQLIPRIIPLAPAPFERRFLELLQTLLEGAGPETTPEAKSREFKDLLTSMTVEEETRLVGILGGLGSFDIVFSLLNQLVSVRPDSEVAYRAYFEAALHQGKQLMDRAQWEEARLLLAGLARGLDGSAPPLTKVHKEAMAPPPLKSAKAAVDNMALIALNSMLGTCACMLQDFDRGAWYFRAAQEVFHREQMSGTRAERHVNSQGAYQGAWVEQNLALAYEWQNKLDKAEVHWARYFDYLEHYFVSSRPADYLTKLAFEGMSRLGDLFTKKEKWTTALGFLQRAHRIRAGDSDTLERLFHLYSQLKKPDEAKRILRRLREVRPNDPQVDLFELDVRDIRSPDDIEQTFTDIRRILQKHAGDMRVEERAGAMIANLVPALERLGDQYHHQLTKVIEQMRRLPSYQINWPVVRNVMRDLEDKFVQLRRAAQKCLALLTSEELRRDINTLITLCDRKLDQCHSLAE